MNSPIVGLTTNEVEEQIKLGNGNINTDDNVRPLRTILANNLFTLFNLVNVILAVLVFLTGSYENMMFIFIVIFNSTIGIYQEIKARMTLNKLKIVNKATIQVLRNQQLETINPETIVLGDIVVIQTGMQIPIDGFVVDGLLEVDESMLTGESNLITKNNQATLYSGSLVMSGKAYVKVTAVKDQTYIQNFTHEARQFQLAKSELKQTINHIVKVVSWVMLPLGISLFASHLLILDVSLNEAILSSVSGIIGMIPEGLVLLISMSLMLGALKMARYQTLVQELPAIEMLARTTTLCLDKTGTLTTGRIEFDQLILINDEPFEDILTLFAHQMKSENPTQMALKERFNTDIIDIQPKRMIEFNSQRKWSAIELSHETWILGAPEFTTQDKEVLQKVESLSSKGFRVLLISKSHLPITDDFQIRQPKAIALLLFKEEIRKSAKKTIEYFNKQNVQVLLISGDHPSTLLNIAEQIGLKNNQAYDAIHLEGLTDEKRKQIIREHSIFGRVLPKQKQMIVQELQKNGEFVAMTGDGVNDVLALKQANCSIAMANGSDATKLVSQIVLLNSDFSSLPKVVLEGRRVINNIERVASLYLVKIIYTTLIILGVVIMQKQYPFVPKQLTMLNALTIGIPSVIFSVVNNGDPIKANFAYRLARNVIPCGVMIAFGVGLTFVYSRLFALSFEDNRTFAVLVTGGIQFVFLALINRPMKSWKMTMYAILLSLFIFVFTIKPIRDFLSLTQLSIREMIAAIMIIFSAYILIQFSQKLFDYIYHKRKGDI